MKTMCPKCGQHLSWKHMEPAFPCPKCGSLLHSTGSNIFGWVGVALAIPAFGVTLEAPWWGKLAALLVAALIAVAAGAIFGRVSSKADQDAT
jgi:hypothetical protein